MKYLLVLLFLTVSVPAQTVSGIISARTSPGTSNRLSFPIAAELAADVAPRISVIARAHYSSEQKTYRTAGRGNAFGLQSDLRIRVLSGLFLSGGINLGRVSYPADPFEPAYSKASFAFRTGAGWQASGKYGWWSAHYSYLWPDKAAFDDGAGHRISNHTRGHEFGADACLRLSEHLCAGPHVQVRRLSFINPNHPEYGQLSAVQTTIGLRIGFVFDILPALKREDSGSVARQVLGSHGNATVPIPERAARPLPDIDCSIHVTTSHESASNATMFPHRQTLADATPASRAILRSERGGHFHDHATGTLSLARVDSEESSPRRVTDASGKVMILHHASDVEVFKNRLVKLPDKLKARLVKEIEPLAFDLQVLSGERLHRLLPARTAPLAPRHFALCGFQATFSGFQAAWILNHFARRERGEVLQANVNANVVAGLRDEARMILFDREHGVVAVGFALDCDGLNRPFNLAREMQPDAPDLRQVQLSALKFPSALRVSERIVAAARAEARIARFLARFDPAKEGG